MEIENDLNQTENKVEKKWEKYDISRNNNQKKIIEQLQEEIKKYKEREKAFKIHLKIKENQIKTLKKEIELLIKRDSELIIEESSKKSNQEIVVDPLLQNEFNLIKSLIKEQQNSFNDKQDLFESLQTVQPNANTKLIIEKCRSLIKENSELYELAEVGVLENLKYENGLAKSQIDQLMLKIKEREMVNSELEGELNDMNQQVNLLGTFGLK